MCDKLEYTKDEKQIAQSLNPECLDVLALKTRWERLSQFICLLGISDNQSVQMTRASDLELRLSISLSDLHQLGVASASLLQKVTDISNLLGHDVQFCEMNGAAQK